MNEQFSQNEFSGEAGNNSIHPALISMQIQALKESLKRLVNQENTVLVELSDSEQNEVQANPEC